MLASHPLDAPERCVRSGGTGTGSFPASFATIAGSFPAFFANDNRTLRKAPRPAGAAGLVLGRESDDFGRLVGTIRILLDDGSYSDPLMITHDADDIIAIWRGLGRDFNLPLSVIGKTGKRLPVTYNPGEVSYARRFGSSLSGRRPRFLRRRARPFEAFATALVDESQIG